MRKILIVIVVLVLLVVGALALAVVNVNGLLEENRGRLGHLASDALGREVSFSKAAVAFPGRLSIEVSGLRVSEDPAYGKGDFLALDTAYVSVELLPALQRRLELTGVRLDHPTIHVIQTKKGFNFASIGAASDAGAKTAPPPASDSSSMALAIAGFRIVGGTILYEDRTSTPPLSLTIEDFESSGSNIFGTDPIDISFTGNARPTKGDAKFASQLGGAVKLPDLKSGVVDLRLESPSFHPHLLGLDFASDGVVERLDDVVLKVAVKADSAKSGFPVTLQSSAGRLAGFDFKKLDTSLVYRSPKLDIKNLVIGLVDGDVKLAGNMTFGPPGKAPFKLDTKLSSLDTDELASILLGTQRGYLSGRIGGDVNLSGDSLDWETLKRSLAGKIQLEMDEATLEKVNLLDRVVNQLLQDPAVGQLAANSIRDVAPSALSGTSTTFKNVNLAFDVAHGALKADNLELKAGDFMLKAAGTLGLDGAVAGGGKIQFSEDLSAKIIKKADKLAPLLGGGKVVELPLLFGGSTSSMKIQPDLAALTAVARANATTELRQEAGKQLSDAIFGKKKKTAPVEGEQPTQKELDRNAAEDLINRGLGELLGK